MIPIMIGIGAGLVIILLFELVRQFNKPLLYGFILTGIGFIYVGFTWTDLQALILSSAQAVFFLMLAYFGTKKNLYILAAGYFLHGSWDMAYNFFPSSNLIPPQYDLFCMSIDFTMGLYILMIKFRKPKEQLFKTVS